MLRSPEDVISQTVPSASTRPKRCGSLAGTTVTGTGAVGAAGWGPGRAAPGLGLARAAGDGRRPGVAEGIGGASVSGASVSFAEPGSVIVMVGYLVPSARDTRTCRAARRPSAGREHLTTSRGGENAPGSY